MKLARWNTNVGASIAEVRRGEAGRAFVAIHGRHDFLRDPHLCSLDKMDRVLLVIAGAYLVDLE